LTTLLKALLIHPKPIVKKHLTNIFVLFYKKKGPPTLQKKHLQPFFMFYITALKLSKTKKKGLITTFPNSRTFLQHP